MSRNVNGVSDRAATIRNGSGTVHMSVVTPIPIVPVIAVVSWIAKKETRCDTTHKVLLMLFKITNGIG